MNTVFINDNEWGPSNYLEDKLTNDNRNLSISKNNKKCLKDQSFIWSAIIFNLTNHLQNLVRESIK